MRIILLVSSFLAPVGVLAQADDLSLVQRNAVVKEYGKCSAYYSHINDDAKPQILKERALELLDYKNTGQVARYENVWNSIIRGESKSVTWLIRSYPTDFDYLHNEFADRCASILENNSYEEILSVKAGMVARTASNASQTLPATRPGESRQADRRQQKQRTVERTKRMPEPLPAVAGTALPDANGLAGEWRGYYQCEGGWEIFMRLGIAPAGDRYDVRFDFSSGLSGMISPGAASMSAAYAPGTRHIVFEPGAWISQPGNAEQIGFEGTLSDGGGEISGNVTGSLNCTTFSVAKRPIESNPVNEDGLLFHFHGPRNITATADHCRAYAEWLSPENAEPFRGAFEFRFLRDQDAMRRVLGKDMMQWGANDYRPMIELARHCRLLIESQQDPALRELIARLNKDYGTWAPRPLMSPKYDRNGLLANHWLRAEQAVMANDSQRALAADILTDVDSLPPTISSIREIDDLLGNLGPSSRNGNRFRQLSLNERNSYIESLQTARVEKATATANVMADGWANSPQTVEGLKAVKSKFEEQLSQLRAIKSVEASETLQRRYEQASEQRAVALWPDWVKTSSATLRALNGADLSRFVELRQSRADYDYLRETRPPRRSDSFYSGYEAAQSTFRQTVDDMVVRSAPAINAWIDSMPASDTARIVLDEFVSEIFEADSVPAQHADLRDRIRVKKRSYNPEGYRRPDIVLALERQHWREVRLVDLDDLAYFWTSLRAVKNRCPRIMPQDGPLIGFSMSFARDAVDRAMSGSASRGEASRLFFLFANNIVNRPGCTIDQYGIVTGCSTQADLDAGREAVMTSSEASADMGKLLSAGCGQDGAAGYIENLETFAGSRYRLPANPKIPDFWTFAGT